VVINPFFITKTKSAVKKDSRYGLIVSKKVFKLATNRNRAKRLLRDWLAHCENLLVPNKDYIFVARAPILGCKRPEGRQKMAAALKKLAK